MAVGSTVLVCVDDDGADDLTRWKLYRKLADKSAAKSDWVRVVDDSGEDYLYPAECFAPVELPIALKKKLLAKT